ncbi:hypothetical protein ACP70R_032674 [Stipagrostis hirtigluma subsp. patula]
MDPDHVHRTPAGPSYAAATLDSALDSSPPVHRTPPPSSPPSPPRSSVPRTARRRCGGRGLGRFRRRRLRPQVWTPFLISPLPRRRSTQR